VSVLEIGDELIDLSKIARVTRDKSGKSLTIHFSGDLQLAKAEGNKLVAAWLKEVAERDRPRDDTPRPPPRVGFSHRPR
jgi:hypothetical protein